MKICGSDPAGYKHKTYCQVNSYEHIFFWKADTENKGTARVQPQQDPGDTLRMSGVGERERERERETRETSLDRAKSARERERESDQTWGAESGRVWQCFIFYHSFYTLS